MIRANDQQASRKKRYSLSKEWHRRLPGVDGWCDERADIEYSYFTVQSRMGNETEFRIYDTPLVPALLLTWRALFSLTTAPEPATLFNSHCNSTLLSPSAYFSLAVPLRKHLQCYRLFPAGM